jgi:hypothetical protein
VKISRIPILFLIIIFLTSLVPLGGMAQAATITFTGTELLSRPEANSISVTIVPDTTITLKYDYGTSSGSYTGHTTSTTATAGQSKTVVINGLTANTKYYYRMQYSTDGGSTWTVRPEHTFWTKRAAGSTYTFDISSDGHVNIMLGNATQWTNMLNDIAADAPDFAIDLGDTVDMDAVSVGDTAGAEDVYEYVLPFFNIVSASSPIFLLPGNHEQKEGWHLTASNTGGNPANSLPVIGTNAQKKYFPNPVPDGFYSGDSSTYSYLTGDQLRQDYYAWTWGDALFVIIEPFWYTTTKPYTSDPGGGESDTTGSGDSWDWTLGLDQFNWLKTTLENSTAEYKFVFAHQMVGGGNISGQADYGHGGANYANLCEWGGYNENGTTWGWDTERPGWGSQPIHQMMVANGVTAFFHGHDHQYAYEKRDGIVYQTVPAGSFDGSFGIYTTGNGYTIWADPNEDPGHLRVTVGPSVATVDFIKIGQSSSTYSYSMYPEGATFNLNMAVDPSGAGTTIPAAGTHSYDVDEVVDISATASAGYAFAYWTGGVANPTAASTTVTMDGDKTVTAVFSKITLDGAVSSGTGAANASSASISHTTGTGSDRLMLVGISWNCGSTDRTISSVTFTPSGGSATPLSLVYNQQAGTQLRHAAIYSLLNPPSGASGTIAVTFSGQVSNGIVVGAANFAGVDQTTPLGTPNGAGSGSNDTAPTVTLTGLNGDELVFDTVFQGASGESQTETPGAGQTQLWNAWISNTRAAGSVEQAAGSSVTMSWTASSASYWAIAAVPINPAQVTAKGLLRVQTIPAVPTSIYLNGFLRENWGLNWVKMPAGSYSLSLSDVYNYDTPSSVTVNYYPGSSGNIQSLNDPIIISDDVVTEVIVNFTELGNLRVETSPPVDATIYCDGHPMDDWAFWTNILPGQYTISFGDKDGYTTPSPQVVTVTAGQTTHITGTYSYTGNPVSLSPHGLLRVQTNPPVPSTIYLDSIPRNAWALNWVKLPAGSYSLSLSDVYNYDTPASVTVNYYPGSSGNIQSLNDPIIISDDVVTEVIVNFTELGNLRVETVTGGVAATISRDGQPMDDWAFWCNIEPGQYTISFETLTGKLTPPPMTVTVTAGQTTYLIGNYENGATQIVIP